MKMRKTILLTFGICAIALMSSCTKTTTTCGTGYEGPNCTPVNVKYAGSYNGAAVVSVNGGLSPAYEDTMLVTSAANPTAAMITLKVTRVSLSATVSDSIFTISGQTVNMNGKNVSITYGSGTLSGKTLHGVYYGTSDGTPFSSEFSGDK